jgi:hypothetical protein
MQAYELTIKNAKLFRSPAFICLPRHRRSEAKEEVVARADASEGEEIADRRELRLGRTGV